MTQSDFGGRFLPGDVHVDSKSKDPLPCDGRGAAPLEVQVPPKAEVTREFTEPISRDAVAEGVASFADVATARRAQAAFEHGFGCASGSVYYEDGTPATLGISGPTDVTATVGNADMAEAWGLTQYDAGAVVDRTSLVLARAGAVLVTLSSGSELSHRPPLQVSTLEGLLNVAIYRVRAAH